MNILVTGAAGFIGSKVCEFLLTKPELIPLNISSPFRQRRTGEGEAAPHISSPLKGEGRGEGVNNINVIGIDNLNDYYDVRLKHWRLDQLKKLSGHPELGSGSLSYVVILRSVMRNSLVIPYPASGVRYHSLLHPVSSI